MRLRWLSKALRNLDDEATYLAVDDATAVRLVVKRAFDAVAQLERQPAVGRPIRVPGTRELLVGNARDIAPYRVQPCTGQDGPDPACVPHIAQAARAVVI